MPGFGGEILKAMTFVYVVFLLGAPMVIGSRQKLMTKNRCKFAMGESLKDQNVSSADSHNRIFPEM